MENSRFHALDGLRGTAVTLVMIAHLAPRLVEGDDWIARVLYWPQALGWCGVDLFFVLSGFLITGILTAHRQAPNYFLAFYAHRAFRIFPPLFLLLAIVLFVLPNFGLVKANPPTWPYWLFLPNLRLILDIGDIDYIGVTWSLGIEEQFYIAWSILVFILPNRRLAMVAVAALLGSVLLRCGLFGHYPNNEVFLFTFSHLDGLCVGTILRLAYDSPRWRPNVALFGRTAWLWALIFAIGMFLDIKVWPQGDIGEWAYSFNMRVGLTLLSLFFGAIMAAGLMRDGAVRKVFDLAALRRLGDYSYFMYLFHFLLTAPIIWFAVGRYGVSQHGYSGLFLLVVEFAVVIFVAHLSFVFFERPIRSLKRFIPFRDPLNALQIDPGANGSQDDPISVASH
jgi:peptidoglycan/LPS O-acetylase OafA/YrhL